MAGERRIDALRIAIAPLCASLGVELYDVQLSPGTMLVTVEQAGGLDLDVVAAVSRSIATMLDAHEELEPSGKYQLEVSSPGIERRLRRQEHFSRVVGERVAVRTSPGTPGERRFEATLLAVDEDEIVLQLEAGERRVAYHDIDRAHLVFDWRRELAASARAERTTTEGNRSSHVTHITKGGDADASPADKERATTS